MFLTIAAGFALETRSRLPIALGAAAMVVAALGIHAIPNFAPADRRGRRRGDLAASPSGASRRDAGAGSSWGRDVRARYGLVAAIGTACGLCVS